jgi:hypothetical protein
VPSPEGLVPSGWEAASCLRKAGCLPVPPSPGGEEENQTVVEDSLRGELMGLGRSYREACRAEGEGEGE